MLTGTCSVTARIDCNLVRIDGPRPFMLVKPDSFGACRYCTITVTVPSLPTCEFMSVENLCAGNRGASPSSVRVFTACDGIAKPASTTRPRIRWPQVAPTELGLRRLDIGVVLSLLIILFGGCWRGVVFAPPPPRYVES